MTKKVVIDYDRNDAGRLHCDECGYDLPEKITFGRHLIGYLCPRCGADMLTESDYIKTEKLFRFIDWLNKWLGPIVGATPKRLKEMEQEGKVERISIHIHGDEVTISRKR